MSLYGKLPKTAFHSTPILTTWKITGTQQEPSQESTSPFSVEYFPLLSQQKNGCLPNKSPPPSIVSFFLTLLLCVQISHVYVSCCLLAGMLCPPDWSYKTVSGNSMPKMKESQVVIQSDSGEAFMYVFYLSHWYCLIISFCSYLNLILKS